MVDDTVTELCSRWGSNGERCPLPADGTYTLLTTSDSIDSEPYPFRVAIYPLATTAGCDAATPTSWDTPTIRVQVRGPLQVDCRAVDARPGERLTVYTSGTVAWISDGSGARICDPVDYDQDGCVLPGAGPYRVISIGSSNQASDPNSYTMQVRRLSDPQGCAAVAVGRYGASPAGPATSNRCRILTVPTAGAYRVAAVDGRNFYAHGRIYDNAGLRVCGIDGCTFPTAGVYTLVVGGGSGSVVESPYATVLLPAAGTGNGCVSVSDQPTAAPQRGEFRAAGQYDCLLVSTPPGAGLTLLRPEDAKGAGRPELSVFDATGKHECDLSQLRDYTCVLRGTAPFRAIVHLGQDTPDVTGRYVLGFARTGGASNCPVLARTAFGSAEGMSVTLAGDRYVGCFSVPAEQHSSTELVAFRRTAGAGRVRVSVFDNGGTRVCRTSTSDVGFTVCRLGSGPATIILVGTAASGTYTITRKDITSSATGCRTVTSTVVGWPAIRGTVTSGADIHCYQVTASMADRMAIDSRDTANTSRAIVLDGSGADAGCGGRVSGCSVTGQARYQILVWSAAATGKTAYELDVWKVWADGKPPKECATIPTSAYGFGPYTGTLTTARPALCVVTTRRYSDDFTIALTNPVNPSDGFYADTGLYAVTGSAGMKSCGVGAGDGRFTCWPGRENAEPTVFLLTQGDRVKPHPYRLEATCDRPLCGGNTFAVARVSPNSVPSGGTRTITVHGTSLHLRDTVEVTPAGHATLTARVKIVSADRTTLTAEVDLTSVPVGPATVTARSYGAAVAPVVLTDAVTITRRPSGATKRHS